MNAAALEVDDWTALVQVLARTDALFYPLRFVSDQSPLASVAAARGEFSKAGVRLNAGGTAAERKAGERDAVRWVRAGAVTAKVFNQARFVRLTSSADAILRQVVGVPTVGQSRDVLRLVAKPPVGALFNCGGVCESSLLPPHVPYRSPEYSAECFLLARKLAALLAAGMIHVWPDTSGLQAVWMTSEGRAELVRRTKAEPKPPALKARLAKRLADQYDETLDEALTERAGWQRDGVSLAIPLGAGSWSDSREKKTR